MKIMQRIASVVAATSVAIGLAISIPGVAHAAQTNVSGTVNTNGSWTNYSVIRTTTSTAINLDPSNLLTAPDGDSLLSIRVLRADGSVLSATTTWVNSSNNRTLISGIPVGTRFRLSACCDQNTSDVSWAGLLTY